MVGVFPSNVITGEHLQPLKDDIQKIRDAQHEQVLAMKAGIGDHANTAKLQARLDKLLLIKDTYFPGH